MFYRIFNKNMLDVYINLHRTYDASITMGPNNNFLGGDMSCSPMCLFCVERFTAVCYETSTQTGKHLFSADAIVVRELQANFSNIWLPAMFDKWHSAEQSEWHYKQLLFGVIAGSGKQNLYFCKTVLQCYRRCKLSGLLLRSLHIKVLLTNAY